MKVFKALLKLDILQLWRNNIIAVALLVSSLYVIAFRLLRFEGVDAFYIILIFSDPVMLGFMFTGVLVLFEKTSGTIKAIWVSPVSADAWLWSKALTLTVLALFCSIIMAFAAKGFAFEIIPFIWSVVFSSLLFVFLGYAGVARVKTFNQYILVLPMVFTPVSLPFLNFLGITDTVFWYILPTQASLILFESSFLDNKGWMDLLYAYLYLPVSVILAWRFARAMFVKNINS
jgi:fluoroquinolone transport system permease protein